VSTRYWQLQFSEETDEYYWRYSDELSTCIVNYESRVLFIIKSNVIEKNRILNKKG